MLKLLKKGGAGMILAEVLPSWITNMVTNGSMFTFTGMAIMFMLIFIETAGIILGFIPGDTILLTVGSLAGNAHNWGHFWLAVMVFGTASLAGDGVNYFFGAFLVRQLSRIKWVARHLHGETMVRLSSNFHRRRWLLFITLGRFLPFIRSAVPLLSHQLGLPFSEYIRMAGFASYLWALVMVAIGYFFGQFNLPGGGAIWLILLFVGVFAFAISRPAIREKIISLFITKN